MVIQFLNGSCTCLLLPCEPIFLVELQLDKQLFLLCICFEFNLKNVFVVFTKLFVNNYFTITHYRSKPTTTTPNPVFTIVDTFKSIPFVIFYDSVHKNIMVLSHDKLASENTTKHQQTYYNVTMVENLKLAIYKTLKMMKHEIIIY